MLQGGVLLALAQAQSLLRSDELIASANTAADLERSVRASLIAGDGAGERIVGAAIALSPDGCKLADLTRCVDGQTLLIISGVVAGRVGLAQSAARLRSPNSNVVHSGPGQVSFGGPLFSARRSASTTALRGEPCAL